MEPQGVCPPICPPTQILTWTFVCRMRRSSSAPWMWSRTQTAPSTPTSRTTSTRWVCDPIVIGIGIVIDILDGWFWKDNRQVRNYTMLRGLVHQERASRNKGRFPLFLMPSLPHPRSTWCSVRMSRTSSKLWPKSMRYGLMLLLNHCFALQVFHFFVVFSVTFTFRVMSRRFCPQTYND